MEVHIRELTVAVGPVTINYAEGPVSGAPLVLLHGGSARSQMLESLVPYLCGKAGGVREPREKPGVDVWTR